MKYSNLEWTIGDLANLIESKKINLRPPYQRNFIWSSKDQKLLIDSIRKGYPLPTLSKILCKWKQDSVVSLFLYLDSVFKHKHKLIHNQAPVMNRLCPFLLNLHK